MTHIAHTWKSLQMMVVLTLAGAMFFSHTAWQPFTAHGQAGTEEVEWSVAPEDNDLGAGRSSFRYTVEPGDSFDDALLVTNYGSQELDLAVFALDGITTEAGTLGLPPSDTAPHQVGSWIDIDTTRLRIASGDQATLDFRVNVPTDASPGDHVGGLVTALTAPGDNQVTIESRLASRVVVSVVGDPTLGVEIDSVEVTDLSTAWIPFAPVTGTLRYEITNTGNVLTRPGPNNSIFLGTVHDHAPGSAPEASDAEETVAVSSVHDLELMPGGTGVLEQEITVWPFFYHRAEIELTPESMTGGVAEPVTARTGVWIIPWGTLTVLIAAVLLVVFGVRFFRKKKVRDAEFESRREAILKAREQRETQQNHEARPLS